MFISNAIQMIKDTFKLYHMSKSNPFVQSVHHSNDQPYSSMARRVLLKHATMLTTQISHAVITFKIPSPHFWMGSVRVWASRVFRL